MAQLTKRGRIWIGEAFRDLSMAVIGGAIVSLATAPEFFWLFLSVGLILFMISIRIRYKDKSSKWD